MCVCARHDDVDWLEVLTVRWETPPWAWLPGWVPGKDPCSGLTPARKPDPAEPPASSVCVTVVDCRVLLPARINAWPCVGCPSLCPISIPEPPPMGLGSAPPIGAPLGKVEPTPSNLPAVLPAISVRLAAVDSKVAVLLPIVSPNSWLFGCVPGPKP